MPSRTLHTLEHLAPRLPPVCWRLPRCRAGVFTAAHTATFPAVSSAPVSAQWSSPDHRSAAGRFRPRWFQKTTTRVCGSDGREYETAALAQSALSDGASAPFVANCGQCGHCSGVTDVGVMHRRAANVFAPVHRAPDPRRPSGWLAKAIRLYRTSRIGCALCRSGTLRRPCRRDGVWRAVCASDCYSAGTGRRADGR